MHVLSPPSWARPKGYSNGLMAEGRMIFLAGLIGWDAHEVFQADELLGQTHVIFTNIVTLLKEAGAGPEHMVRMTWYVKDMQGYRSSLGEIGAHYRKILGKNFPVMTCVQVGDLVERQAKIEIEVTAILPYE